MQIRLLKKNEINKFQNFINSHYKKGHILSKSKKLVNFYYNFFNNKKYYLVGEFNKTKLLSVIGIIPYKNWDKNLSGTFFIALWSKHKKIFSNPLKLLNFILKKIKPKFLATTGINLKTSGKIFKQFNKINMFENFYIKNENLNEKISKNLKCVKISKNKKQLNLVVSKKIFKNYSLQNKFYPKKTLVYFENKYLKNPFYTYSVFNFFEKKNLRFFLICREIKIKKHKSKIIRIIDFFGNIKGNFSVHQSLQLYLQKHGYEYIDFLGIGIGKYLKTIGFIKKNSKNFIPELFEPFVKNQIHQNYCILKSNYKNNVLVKGDGDLDRPNLI